jgi:hypothetical protein
MSINDLVVSLEQYIAGNIKVSTGAKFMSTYLNCFSCSKPVPNIKYMISDVRTSQPSCIIVCDEKQCMIKAAEVYISLSIFLMTKIDIPDTIWVPRSNGTLDSAGWIVTGWRMTSDHILSLLVSNNEVVKTFPIKVLIENNAGNINIDLILQKIDEQIRKNIDDINMMFGPIIALKEA